MKKLILILIILLPFNLKAQDELANMLDSITKPKTDYASATFKTTRIVTSHSVESMKRGQLEFRVSHRFGSIKSGVDQFWGIDQSTIFIGLSYGITDWLEMGVGRTPNEKIFNGFAKLKLLRQCSGESNIPFTMVYMGSTGVSAAKWSGQGTNYFTSRLSYVNQLMFARKFNEELSIQLSPAHIHRNMVESALDDNDVFSIGIGGRYKIAKRMSFNIEYFYVVRPIWNIKSAYTNPISVGVDIETGGHVFQIMLTNSIGMIEKHYIAENLDDFTKGEIHLGFNISRVFTLVGE